MVLYYSVYEYLLLIHLLGKRRVKENTANTWATHYFICSTCHLFFWLQDIEHNIEDLYCSCAKENVIITVIKINVISALESILCGSEMRREMRLAEKLWNRFGAFMERFVFLLFFFFTANSAVGVLQINSDSEAGHSLEWKRQITRGEEREERKSVSVCTCKQEREASWK